jgi:hypothetical protein
MASSSGVVSSLMGALDSYRPREPGPGSEAWLALWATLGLTLALQPVSHLFSSVCFPTYRTLGDKQTEWNTRVVSNLHATLVTL